MELEVAEFRNTVERLLAHRVFRIHASTSRMLWSNFLRGVAFGFGSVLGATVLVSVAIFALSSIDFVPVIGTWAAEIITVIDNSRSP